MFLINGWCHQYDNMVHSFSLKGTFAPQPGNFYLWFENCSISNNDLSLLPSVISGLWKWEKWKRDVEPAAGLSSKAAFITPTPRTLGCCHLSDGASAGAQSWPESSHHFHPWTPWVSLSLKTQWVGIFQILHSKTLLESLIKGPRRSPLTFPTWVA